MAIRTRLRLTALVSTAALISLALIPGVATAKTKPTDLRVVTSSGVTLAEYTQFTGSTIAKASKKADCFGEDNPSSNRKYKLKGSNALSALIDGASHDDALNPLRLTDAFVDDGFGFGVCRVGDYSFSPVNFSYWYNANGYQAGTTGPDLIPVKRGEHVLWYLTNGSESGFPSELELKVPVRVKSDQAFTAKVVRHLGDGSAEPAQGVQVSSTDAWTAPTDSSGKVDVPSGAAGKLRLQATGGSDDVPSSTKKVCVGDAIADCLPARGETIYGSSHGDRIKGSKGKDKIGAGAGSDRIDVHSGGPDKVVCGKGRDLVIRAKHQRGLRLKGCEKVKRR